MLIYHLTYAFAAHQLLRGNHLTAVFYGSNEKASHCQLPPTLSGNSRTDKTSDDNESANSKIYIRYFFFDRLRLSQQTLTQTPKYIPKVAKICQ